MSKKLMSLVLGSLVVAQMSMVAAETQVLEQNKEEQKEVVAIAQDVQQQIQNLVKGAEAEGLSKEQATALVVEKIEQEVKATTGTSMLTARDRRALTVLVIGVAIGVGATLLVRWLINKIKTQPSVNTGTTVGASAGSANAAGTASAPSATSTSAASASTNAASTTNVAASSGTTGTTSAPSTTSTSAASVSTNAASTSTTNGAMSSSAAGTASAPSTATNSAISASAALQTPAAQTPVNAGTTASSATNTVATSGTNPATNSTTR